MAKKPDIPPLNGLLRALREQQIQFIVVGMTSAVIQGGPFVTLDVDRAGDTRSDSLGHLSTTVNLGAYGDMSASSDVVEVFDEERSALQILGVAECADGHVDARALGREGGQVRGHDHGRYVAA